MTDTANGATPLPATRARIAQSYEMMFPRSADTPKHAPTDETSHGAASADEEVSQSSQPRWSGARAFLLGWLLPSTMAQRTQDLSLRRTWLVHFVAGLTAAVVIVVAIICTELHEPLTPAAIAIGIGEGLGKLADEFRRHPYAMAFEMLGVFLLIETGHAVLSLLLMAWGARDEPLRSSYRNALRQVWLRTAHVIPAAILISCVAVPLSRMERDWNAGYSVPAPEWPEMPVGAAPGSKAMTEYNDALQDYWPVHSDWRSVRDSVKPWYLLASSTLVAVAVVFGISWFLWAMLRSIGAPRRVAPIARPPMCENCGYNLLTIPPQSRCPECARPVLASLGPDVRPGPMWQNRRTVGRVSAWFRCVLDPVRRPTEFGMQCRLGSHRVDHRLFLLLHLPPIFLTALAAIVHLFISTVGSEIDRELIMIFVSISFSAAFACCIGTLGVTLAASTIIGLHHSLREKRNLLPGAMQVASYLGGFLMLWAMLGALLILGVVAMGLAGIFESLQDRWGINTNAATRFAIVAPNVLVGIWYLVLLSRGTTATRYANK